VVLAVVSGLLACETFTEVLGPIRYTASLDGATVRPAAITTNATGQLTATLDRTTLQWSYIVGWENLSSAASGVHLHGPAAASEVGDLILDLNDGDAELTPTGSVTGTIDLTAAITPTVSGDSLRKLLNGGHVYVDVHTVNNTAGEIRGQLRSH
jgi:hypothetical protein